MPFRLFQRPRCSWGRGYSGRGLSGSTSALQGVGRGTLKHRAPPGGLKGSHGAPSNVWPLNLLCMALSSSHLFTSRSQPTSVLRQLNFHQGVFRKACAILNSSAAAKSGTRYSGAYLHKIRTGHGLSLPLDVRQGLHLGQGHHSAWPGALSGS
jgi:hypothetical protein